MQGYRFISEMCVTWQDKAWMKLDATCPYWIGHVTRHLSFVRRYHFRKYYNYPASARKLYWKLHPKPH